MRTKDFNETEILRKAIAIFWAKGYYATSLNDLIEGLGIGRSSIYHTFRDKQHLFYKALELYQQEATLRIEKLLNNAVSAKAAIRQLLKQVINDVVITNYPKGCFKINTEVEVAPHDELIKKLLMDDDQLINDALFRVLKKGQRNGEISRSKDLRSLTDFICNSIAGMRVYAKLKNDRKFFDGVVSVILTALD